MTDPIPTDADLDQAVIDCGRALVAALAAVPLDPDAVQAASDALDAARAARGYA